MRGQIKKFILNVNKKIHFFLKIFKKIQKHCLLLFLKKIILVKKNIIFVNKY